MICSGAVALGLLSAVRSVFLLNIGIFRFYLICFYLGRFGLLGLPSVEKVVFLDYFLNDLPWSGVF